MILALRPVGQTQHGRLPTARHGHCGVPMAREDTNATRSCDDQGVTTTLASHSGIFAIGGDLTVNRLGFGAMRITGPGIWGDPADPDEAVRVLRRAVELGVNLIDTADSYGPVVSEQLIRRALHPYPADLVIATKAGLTRQGPNRWAAVGRPDYLRQQCEMSLRNLGLERIDLYQLHRIDPQVPLSDQIGELAALRAEGKIRHIGLSEVTVAELQAAAAFAPMVSVQNRYNATARNAEALLDYCTANGIGFIPWNPLAAGGLTGAASQLAVVAQRTGHSPSQVALAWLLKRSSVMLPIPGTSTVAHLEDNMAAAAVQLSDEDFEAIAAGA
jgi:aryl-alcohol dehydrogenase-like predicted oxidoreductase